MKRVRKNLRNEWIRLSQKSSNNQDDGEIKIKIEKKDTFNKEFEANLKKDEHPKRKKNEERNDDTKKSLDWVKSLQGDDKIRIDRYLNEVGGDRKVEEIVVLVVVL